MHEHKSIEKVISRLSKIEGHIRAIKKMLEEEQPCDQILIQMSAVKSALNKATTVLLEDHFDHCILEKNNNSILEKELLDFKKLLEAFTK